MKKKYKIKKTNKLIKKLCPYWRVYNSIKDKYYKAVNKLNTKMEKETGIKGIEIFESEYGVGIGNADRTMKLIHGDELKKGKVIR